MSNCRSKINHNLLLAVAGYYLVSNSGKGFFTRSGKSVPKEVKGSNRFKVCRSFVRKDKKLLASVGKNDRLTLLNDEVLVWEGIDISPLTNLKGLKQLNLHKCNALVDLTPLTKIGSLRVLHLPPTTTDEKLAQVLAHLPQLEKVILKDCPQITDISLVAGLTNLMHLEMNYAPKLVDITPLAGLTRLKVLDLKNTRVQDLEALAKLSGLEWLYLSDSKRVNDISPLKNLTNLRILTLNGCNGVRDITALSKLTKLTILNLSGLEEISDISTLSNLTQLRNLYLQRCKKISPTQIRELRKSLPRCSIEYRDAHLGVAR